MASRLLLLRISIPSRVLGTIGVASRSTYFIGVALSRRLIPGADGSAAAISAGAGEALVAGNRLVGDFDLLDADVEVDGFLRDAVLEEAVLAASRPTLRQFLANAALVHHLNLLLLFVSGGGRAKRRGGKGRRRLFVRSSAFVPMRVGEFILQRRGRHRRGSPGRRWW